MAWMNAETLRLTLEEGRTVFWSRSRQELWRKGETSGERQWVREAYYDCDGDALLFVVEQEGRARATPASTRASSARSAGRRGPAVSDDPADAQPRRVPRPGARPHRRAGLDGAAGRPRDAGRGLRQARRRRHRLPARVGRARRAVEPVLVRRARPGGHARAARRARHASTASCPMACRSTGACWPPSRRCCTSTARRRCPTCRRCTAASSATSATTSCARSSACPTCRPTTAACPTR